MDFDNLIYSAFYFVCFKSFASFFLFPSNISTRVYNRGTRKLDLSFFSAVCALFHVSWFRVMAASNAIIRHETSLAFTHVRDSANIAFSQVHMIVARARFVCINESMCKDFLFFFLNLLLMFCTFYCKSIYLFMYIKKQSRKLQSNKNQIRFNFSRSAKFVLYAVSPLHIPVLCRS